MDAERLAFLYGDDVELDEWDLTDLDQRSALLTRTFEPDIPVMEFLPLEIVANQIYDDTPPGVWNAAQRMLAAGLDRDAVFDQLAIAFSPVMRAAFEREERYDEAAYERTLARLPVPAENDIEIALVELVRAHQGIDIDEVVRLALEQLGRDADDEFVEDTIDHVLDQLIFDMGPLAWVGGDNLVEVADLTEGCAFTHRLTEIERETGEVDATFDLAGYLRRRELRVAGGGPIAVRDGADGKTRWVGPPGWLDGFAASSLLVFRCDSEGDEGIVSVEGSADEPEVDATLVERVRSVYDSAVDEPWLPVRADEIVLGLLLADRDTFAAPVAPLSSLCEAADLERRADEVAHDETVWHNDRRMRSMWRIFDSLRDVEGAVPKALRALDAADAVAGVDMSKVPEHVDDIDETRLRSVLADLRDVQVLSVVAIELFDHVDPEAPPRAAPFTEALVAAAKRPADKATAYFLASLHAERSLDPITAESHLELALAADPTNPIAIDRAAWYASDRGDAVRAAKLWQRLEPTDVIEQDLRAIERHLGSAHSKTGRNEPCWCGSGRKYKQCHLGSTELAPLPDRVGWLSRKAVGFVERRGDEARDDVIEIAVARATDPDDRRSLSAALEDPLVMDLVLTECGWFDRFIEERGPLLPPDELLLAEAWALVDRTVYEIVEVDRGQGVTLRDLRTGDRFDVRDRLFSTDAHPGDLVCARAVPDGATHQLVGGVFTVAVGRESALLDMLDEGDALDIAEWVAAMYRPPEIRTREGEAMVECEIAVHVADAEAARAILDDLYELDESAPAKGEAGHRWVELFALNDDEDILRARLRLDGSKLMVSTTSEERADRVLVALHDALPDATIVSDRRRPIDVRSMMRRHELEGSLFPDEDDDDEDDGAAFLESPEGMELLEQVRDQFEVRWCDEEIPALGGITPRQAADDPTRRGDLERLIKSFERPTGIPSAITMRPERLRELLDLT